jgi:pimeloyl-ACP methyl ester carboxylesterase
MKGIRIATRAVAPVAEAVAVPGPTRPLFFGVFFARPSRLPRDEAAYAVRAYAGAPAFSAACDWLFSRRAGPLGEVGCPVTIAWGTRDLVLLPRQARHFLAQVPSARLVTLDRLGHVPMWDDPPRVAGVILERTTGRASAPPASSPPPTAQALRPAGG